MMSVAFGEAGDASMAPAAARALVTGAVTTRADANDHEANHSNVNADVAGDDNVDDERCHSCCCGEEGDNDDEYRHQ